MPKWTFFLLITVAIFACNMDSKDQKKTNESEPNQALASISKEIEKNPKDAALLFKRGKLYHNNKEDSLALRDFELAAKLDSTKAEYFSTIGNLLFDHKDITGSVAWFQKAIDLDPGDETSHLKMAKLFLFTEEYPKAFTSINTVLRKNVYNAEAYFLKGMCYKSMKDTNRAISGFQTAVQTDPKYVDAYMQLALIYEAKKDPIALKYFENAFRADSSSLEPLYGAGMFWQNQNNFSEAKKVFNRIISIDKNYPKSYYNIGWMLLQEDSTEKAKRLFEMAIQVKPDYIEAYYNRGLCSEILGDIKAAIEDYQQALNFDPNIPDIKNALARAKQKQK